MKTLRLQVLHKNKNKSKGGTNAFDKLCHAYTTTHGTKRCSTRFFFGILDQAHVNARILHTYKHFSSRRYKSVSAKNALKELVLHLVGPWLREKLELTTIRTGIKKGIQFILCINFPLEITDVRSHLQKRVRCTLCSYKEDRKTNMQYPYCTRSMYEVCPECIGPTFISRRHSVRATSAGMNVNSKASRTYRLLADVCRTYSSCAACLCLQSYF